MKGEKKVIITNEEKELFDKSPDQSKQLIDMGYVPERLKKINNIALQVRISEKHINIIAHTHGQITILKRADSYYYFYQSEITKTSPLKEILNDFNKCIKDESNKGIFLFCWDEILRKDDKGLTDILSQIYNKKWIESSKIEKNNDGNTIEIYDTKNDTKNKLSLTLNEERTKVNLIFSDGKDDFIVKIEEEDKLNIYKSITITNVSDTLCLFEDLENAIHGYDPVSFNEDMIKYAKKFFEMDGSLQLETNSIKNAIYFLCNIYSDINNNYKTIEYTLYNIKLNTPSYKNEVCVFINGGNGGGPDKLNIYKTSSEIEPSGEFREYIEEKIKTSLLERNNVITEGFLTHLKEDFEKIEDLRKKVEKDAKVNDKINKEIKDFNFKNRLNEYFNEQKELIIIETMNYFKIIKNLKS